MKPFQECLNDGYLHNAQLRAEEPTKLFFPSEVVVVATFEMLDNPLCAPSSLATAQNILCNSALAAMDLTAHLEQSDMELSGGSIGSNTYQGVRAGAGLPRGTPREVVLRPEDVLEVVGLLARDRRLGEAPPA